jgi:Anthrone oxygenase
MLLVLRFVLLFASGLVAGATVCVWLVERVFIGSPGFFVALKQLEIRAFTVPLPALALLAVICALVYAVQVRRNRLAMGLILAGVVLFGISGFITARVHFPMNDRIWTWSPEAPPAEWADVRDRWRGAHQVRTLTSVLGFGLFLCGAMMPAQGRSDT